LAANVFLIEPGRSNQVLFLFELTPIDGDKLMLGYIAAFAKPVFAFRLTTFSSAAFKSGLLLNRCEGLRKKFDCQ